MSAQEMATTDSKNALEAPTPMWYGVSDPLAVPNTSMLPPSDEPSSATDDLLGRAVHGAHAAVDRLADGVGPRVRQVAASVASAEGVLEAKAEQVRETRDQWSNSLRTTVREHPLVSLAGAMALGVLIARVTG